MRVIGKLLCKVLGHRRGRRVSNALVACPRCDATWIREKVAKAPQPANRGETMHTLYEGKVAK